MKKIICLLFLVFLTQSTWAAFIQGQVNWGPFVNCEIYNNTHRTTRVFRTTYNLTYTNGLTQTLSYNCNSNCNVRSYDFKRFSGPTNSPFILRATCSFQTVRRGHRHPRK